ncbi:hypothetical protein SISNIDRAFT_533895 [Sistotremastrum niveocremeum HHB9708]|uniref:Uncharacterized protein n=1 Tax=Sistotremastrum niveocremeum HHB9708 TaxID=1314777 RepID=A0A164YDD8_9AGAM|nr:hypothetical protein SISNIDRAFT_533895 [Sistotremastrum niveocremeum HHB9708]
MEFSTAENTGDLDNPVSSAGRELVNHPAHTALYHEICAFSEYDNTEAKNLFGDDGPEYYQNLFYCGFFSSDPFIHERFCTIYPVHQWAHDPLIRSLLFQHFCLWDRMPSIGDTAAIFVLCKDLRRFLNKDVWKRVADRIVAINLAIWRARHKDDEDPHNVDRFHFSTLSTFQRSLTLIFVDAEIYTEDDNESEAFPLTVSDWLTQPMEYASGVPELWKLPFVEAHRKTYNTVTFPTLDSSLCTCGGCPALLEKITTSPGRMRLIYDVYIKESIDRGCSILEECLDNFLIAVESWFDEQAVRIQSPGEILPPEIPQRWGPSIIDAATLIKMSIGSDLSTNDLIRLVTILHDFTLFQGIDIDTPWLEEDWKDAAGYFSLAKVRNGTDLPDIIAGGNWLPELAESSLDHPDSKVMIISPSDESQFIINGDISHAVTGRFVYMPHHPKPDIAWNFPSAHATEEFSSHSEDETMTGDDGSQYTLTMSSDIRDGFPLFRGAIKLGAEFMGRTYDTWWKPVICLGQKCVHTQRYQIASRCSMSAKSVLMQMKPPSQGFEEHCTKMRSQIPLKPMGSRDSDVREFGSPENDGRYRGVLSDAKARREHEEWLHNWQSWQSDYRSLLLEELSRRDHPLQERGGPFERHAALFVRCTDDNQLRPLIFLSASCGRPVYLIDYQECWDCAVEGMVRKQCSVAIATGKVVDKREARAQRIAAQIS